MFIVCLNVYLSVYMSGFFFAFPLFHEMFCFPIYTLLYIRPVAHSLIRMILPRIGNFISHARASRTSSSYSRTSSFFFNPLHGDGKMACSYSISTRRHGRSGRTRGDMQMREPSIYTYSIYTYIYILIHNTTTIKDIYSKELMYTFVMILSVRYSVWMTACRFT